MNKQEAIEKLTEIANGTGWISHKSACNVVVQIHEPQKVVVPKFVAEWIKGYRHTNTVLKILNAAENERVTPSAVNDWILDNQRDFVIAWYDGYEIEQEKLYTVEIAEAILTKITRGSNVQYKMLPFGNVSDVFDKAIYTTRLTEQEIKQKDERLWQFAKEVGR
ncbi:DUF1642 domain-containing protein [Streptococcus suis]|uniref:DUF1642 domain-containing protein n=1 Tax=Streptococcus suis TaxID=1307 RepID=UPI0013747CD5|nr:DUF1642 domain-containing protein [Streptococcus suis]